MKGFRTILTGLAVAVGPAALTYFAGIDWTQFVGPNFAMLIAGGLTIGLRFVTTGSVFKA
jgi:hypothetical protein